LVVEALDLGRDVIEALGAEEESVALAYRVSDEAKVIGQR
jgi:hypothetical protein